MLEGFQAGLSWITILRKREAFRKAFRNFDPRKVARFTEEDIQRLLEDPGIVRSRAKIQATIEGARIYLAMQAAGEDFSRFAWSFVGWEGDTKQRAGSGDDSAGRGDFQGAQEARIQVCRAYHRLRVDAGGGNGQRPRAGLLSAEGCPVGLDVQPKSTMSRYLPS